MVARNYEHRGVEGAYIRQYAVERSMAFVFSVEIAIFPGNVRLLDVHEEELVAAVMLLAGRRSCHRSLCGAFSTLHAEHLCKAPVHGVGGDSQGRHAVSLRKELYVRPFRKPPEEHGVRRAFRLKHLLRLFKNVLTTRAVVSAEADLGAGARRLSAPCAGLRPPSRPRARRR